MHVLREFNISNNFEVNSSKMKGLTYKDSKIYVYNANENQWVNFPRFVGEKKLYTDKKFGRLGTVIWDKILQSYKTVEVERKKEGKKKECPFLEEKKYISRLKATIPAAYRFGESPFTTVQLLMIKEGEPLTLEDQKEFASCYFMIGYNQDPQEFEKRLFLCNDNKRIDAFGSGKEGKIDFGINEIIHGYLPEYDNTFKLEYNNSTGDKDKDKEIIAYVLKFSVSDYLVDLFEEVSYPGFKGRQRYLEWIVKATIDHRKISLLW